MARPDWPEPCHGDLSYFISGSILISLSLNLNLHSLSIFLIGNIVCIMCIYSVLCSVIGGYSQQAKILSYGGWGWVLGPRYKINHMLCLGHPIHFITFIPCPIYIRSLKYIGCTEWPMFKGGDTNSDDGDSVQATMTMLYYDEG